MTYSRNKSMRLGLLCLLFAGSSVLAQKLDDNPFDKGLGGQWRLIESKDELTDQVTNAAVLNEKSMGSDVSLSVGNTSRGSLIAVMLPSSPPGRSITIEWRVDDLPVVEESWTVAEKAVGTVNNRSLLKAMAGGARLRLRLKGTKTILEYDIRGLSYYLPKLGLSVRQ